jgi:hypothetical protein
MVRILSAFMLLAALSPALSQSPARVYRVGFLTPAPASDENRPGLAKHLILTELAHFGLVVGKNLSVESRYADGALERLPEVVVSLKTAKSLGVDLPISFLARADELIE